MQVATIEPQPLPELVRATAAALAGAGGRCWLVGGTVRDLLRGERPRDFDLATDLPPASVLRALPEATGRDARLGVCQAVGPDGPLSITTLRTEGGYRDARHPDVVEFVCDPAIDARRRDFTINALYVDPASWQLLDPTGGRQDLAAGRLRAIGDPAVRFGEDPLRLLRAVRFLARCGLDWDPATRAAATAAAAGLRRLSAERTFQELNGMLTGPGRGRALRELVAVGFASVLLPEVAAMDGVPQPPEYHPEGDVLTHVALVLDQVPADDAVLAWSAVLHDIGKPPTFRRGPDRIRFDGHDQLSATMADAVLRRLHSSNELREQVVEICRDHIKIAALPAMRPVKAERWMRSPLFHKHLAFHRADCMGSHGDLRIHAFAEQALAALGPVRPPLLTGSDVLALGVPPGPAVGRLLRAAEAVVEASSEPWDRPRALVLLREMVGAERQG